MKLEDLISTELYQDDWSLNKLPFGDYGKFTVIGWSYKRSCGVKLYIVKCDKCARDPELFGQGYFRNTRVEITSGRISCGCNKKHHWSKEQYEVLCQRKAKHLGYKFLGFVGEWRGKDTRIKMLCEEHGEWLSHIAQIIYANNRCKKCVIISQSIIRTKPDDEMINSFHDSGAFHPDTKFWRSERETRQGGKSYWYMSCPECGDTGESVSSNLQQGRRPCACSTHRQRESYINLIRDDSNIVAIKFGIANNSEFRVKQQNSKSAYTLKQHSVYEFPSVRQCKQAERECLEELDCGVVLRRDMPDGWTETTWVYNLDKITEIYERNGGIKK